MSSKLLSAKKSSLAIDFAKQELNLARNALRLKWYFVNDKCFASCVTLRF